LDRSCSDDDYTVTFFRFSTENANGPQIFSAQAPFERPVLVSPRYFLTGAGEDDVNVISRAHDVGNDWSTTTPEIGDLFLGFEAFVASSETGATGGFMAVGPLDANTGMFGVQPPKIAGENAQVGRRSLERENTLKLAIKWIARQQEDGGLLRQSTGQSSQRLSNLALACLAHRNGGYSPYHDLNISLTMQALSATEMRRSSLPDDQPFMLWAMGLESAHRRVRNDFLVSMEAKRLIDQQDPSGGWRSRPPDGLIDTRMTAWSLFALQETGAVNSDSAREKAAEWLAHFQTAAHSSGEFLPLPADPHTGTAGDPHSDLLWVTFAVLMADNPEQRAWGEALAAELARTPVDENLFADPERLLVHTLIRIRAHTEGWMEWLRHIEARLDERQEWVGPHAGSWTHPITADRLEFTLWNTLVLHEVYAY
jgi:hypothetical protein